MYHCECCVGFSSLNGSGIRLSVVLCGRRHLLQGCRDSLMHLRCTVGGGVIRRPDGDLINLDDDNLRIEYHYLEAPKPRQPIVLTRDSDLVWRSGAIVVGQLDPQRRAMIGNFCVREPNGCTVWWRLGNTKVIVDGTRRENWRIVPKPPEWGGKPGELALTLQKEKQP